MSNHHSVDVSVFLSQEGREVVAAAGQSLRHGGCMACAEEGWIMVWGVGLILDVTMSWAIFKHS